MRFNVEKLDSYTIMPNEHLRDKRIKLATKGLLSIMYSLPNDWDFSMKGLCKITDTGITAIRNYITELEIFGYIERKQRRTEKGTFEYIYYVYTKPKKVNPRNSISIRKMLEKINNRI